MDSVEEVRNFVQSSSLHCSFNSICCGARATTIGKSKGAMNSLMYIVHGLIPAECEKSSSCRGVITLMQVSRSMPPRSARKGKYTHVSSGNQVH